MTKAKVGDWIKVTEVGQTAEGFVTGFGRKGGVTTVEFQPSETPPPQGTLGSKWAYTKDIIEVRPQMPSRDPAQEFDYRLLGRLKQDCLYYLGNGNRSQKHLWAGNEADQIAKMRELYAGLREKPQWLTMEDIAAFETAMVTLPAASALKDITEVLKDHPEATTGNSKVHFALMKAQGALAMLQSNQAHLSSMAADQTKHQQMQKFRLVAETSNGSVIKDEWVTDVTEKGARAKFWSELNDDQRNATASIECVDTSTNEEVEQ